MPFAPPVLHAADAAAHGPAWLLAACLAGGAAAGLLLAAGAGLAAKLRPGPRPPFAVGAWAVRDGAWFAELRATAPAWSPAAGTWRLVTASGGRRPLTVELLPGRGRFGLLAPAAPGDEPVALEFLPLPGGQAIRCPLPLPA